MTSEIYEALHAEIYGVWFLIGAALVFWMQAGFAMVETGFARAKNAGNILMKNLMDFCIGTVMFVLVGFGLMFGENALGGFLGIPSLQIFSDYANFDWSTFVFNLVFCATTATIVSGAMAERTKFLSYCVYSAVISAVIYPIEAHWTWGGGWLAGIGFHDFAGSNCIHMVGGIDRQGQCISGSQHSAWRARCFHFMARLVRLQRRGGDKYSAARKHFPDDDGRTFRRDSCLHDLYLDPLRQARRLHVSERFPGRSGRDHSAL